MIIFSSHKLEKCLANGTLSNWAKTKYIVLPAVLMALYLQRFILVPTYGSRPHMLNMLASFACAIANAFVTYLGIKKCFRTNESIDKRDFFVRFFVLSVPAAAKLLLFSLPLSLLLGICVHIMKDQAPLVQKRFPIVFSVLSPAVTWLYYMLIDRSITRVGRAIADKKRKRS